LGLLLDAGDAPAWRPLHLPHRRGGLGGQDQEHTWPRRRVGGEMLLGDPVLALPGRAVDDRDAVRARPRLDPAGEPARAPHQVRVIQLIVGAAVPPPPPRPEPPRAAPQAAVRLHHTPAHAARPRGPPIAIPSG